MGKIVAIGGAKQSGDVDLFPIFRHICELSGRTHPELVFMPTGHYDTYDEGWAKLFGEFLRLGCRIRLLFQNEPGLSRAELTDVLTGADIIYSCGGNLKYIADTWNASGAADAIRTAYSRGAVLAGTSSGSMCWFNEGWDDCGADRSMMFVPALGLLPYCNCPHYESERWNKFDEAVRTRKISGIAAENSAALVYDGEKCYTVQGEDKGRVYLFDHNSDFRKEDVTGLVWPLK